MADVFLSGASYDIIMGVSSTQAGQVISPGITVVRLLATANCYVQFGANPTAAKPGSMRLATSIGEYFRCVPGQKIAVLPDSGSGAILTITEMSG